MIKIKNWPWIVLVVLVVILALWIGVRWWNRGVVGVKTAKIVRGPIEALVTASGIMDAPVYDLGPKMGGKIVDLSVKEGDRVAQGETLVEFDDSTRLIAPQEGLVAKINYDEGETVIPGSTVVSVVNYDKSWVEAQIDEIDSANVRIGDKVKITSDVYPDKVYEGVIYWIAPVAELRRVGGRVKMDEESYVFPCKIRLLNGHSELKVNMSVNVDIITEKKENAVIVPREALLSKDDSSLVFVISKDRSRERKIGTGIRSFTSIEAVSGLTEGEIVAVSNVSKLKDKGRVKLEQ
ncbi:efflux RND transporter periplasmic adaptor subunit [Candidatus Saganbacteria bacterium]|nr:efflux RND transporter periplasmic adaptor subunit [Candidatus Saganbacteria bacterium]